MTGSRPSGPSTWRTQAFAQSQVCTAVQGAAACSSSHTASTLGKSPVIRSETAPRLVSTGIGPLRSILLSRNLGVSAEKGSETHTQIPSLMASLRPGSLDADPVGNRFARNHRHIDGL